MIVQCELCGENVETDSRFTWQGIFGWHRPGRAGGSDVAARRKLQRWACDPCVRREQQGVIAGQQELA